MMLSSVFIVIKMFSKWINETGSGDPLVQGYTTQPSANILIFKALRQSGAPCYMIFHLWNMYDTHNNYQQSLMLTNEFVNQLKQNRIFKNIHSWKVSEKFMV